MKLKLITTSIAGVGTFGRLYKDGEQICVTVEREWKNNERNVSCIPAGDYIVSPHHSPKFGDVLALESRTLGVTIFGPSQRTHCLFHAANWPHQLQGCIAPGKGFNPQTWGVAQSKDAMKNLLELIKAPTQLTIERFTC